MSPLLVWFENDVLGNLPVDMFLHLGCLEPRAPILLECFDSRFEFCLLEGEVVDCTNTWDAVSGKAF